MQSHTPAVATIASAPFMTRFLSLDPVERAIVELCSVFYAPTPRTDIARALGDLGYRKDRRAYGPSDILPILEDLTAKGWLRGETHWCAAPELAHSIIEHTAAAQQLERMARAVRAFRPVKHGGSWEEAVRELRIELYSKRWDEARSCLGRMGPGAFADICRPYDDAWVSRLPGDLQARAVKEVLEHSLRQLVPAAEALAHLERMTSLDDHLQRVFVEQMIMRGRLDDAERLLEHRDSLEAIAGRAWLLAVRGQWSDAVEAFESALVRYLKECGKRARFFPDRAGPFFILALIARGDPASLERAKALAEAAAKPGISAVSGVYAVLSPAIDVLAHRLDAEHAPRVGSEIDAVRIDPLERLLRALAALWIGKRAHRGLIDHLAEQAAEAEAAGYAWLAAQSAEIVAQIDPARAESMRALAARRSGASLAGAVRPSERWSSALDALAAIASSGGVELQDDSSGDRRLAWIVIDRHGRLDLEPREQTRTKGTWSKGRPVAMKRLHAESSSIPFLDEADRSACALIEEHVSTSYYGRYRDYWYSLDAGRALRALAHSSNVLIEEEGALRPAEIRIRSPRLSIETAPNGSFRATLVPTPASEAECVRAQRVGETVIELVDFEKEHHAIAKVLGKSGLDLPPSAEHRLREIARALSGVVAVDAQLTSSDQEHAVEGDPTPRFVVRRVGEGISIEGLVRPHGARGADARPGAGGTILFGEIDGRRVPAKRDLLEETRRKEHVLERCPRLATASTGADRYGVIERSAALEVLAELRALGDAIALEWPESEMISVTDPISTDRLEISLRGEGDRFEAEGSLDAGAGDPLALHVLLEYLAASPGRFVRIGDQDRFLALTVELRDRLEDLRALAQPAGRSKQRLRFHPLDVSAVDALVAGAKVERNDAWMKQIARMGAGSDDIAVPATFRGELRPYQHDGFRWLARIARWGAGACLADEMGLGKTVQSIALLVLRAANGPSLIVAPTSVVANWAEELARFGPTLRVRVLVAGEDRARKLDGLGPFDVVLTSYALLVQDLDSIERIRFEVALLDEAQAIKNADTQRARAACRIDAAVRIATTGTPIENRLDELWSLFAFLNPDMLGTRESFATRFGRPIEQAKDARALDRLKRRVAPFLLRRTKTGVMEELPPRIEVSLRVDLEQEELALYEAIRQKALDDLEAAKSRSGAGMRLLAAIMQLRRAASNARLVLPDMSAPSAKLALLGEMLEGILPGGHKVLVFSQFVDHLQLVRAFLEERNISFQYLDGGTPAVQRSAAIEAFQRGVADVFLISLGAGGVGLNLTAADYVVHLDPWWNPAVEDQASDRAHRIGQTRPVTIYRLVAKNTIEDKILALHRRKRELALSVLAGSDVTGRMTEREMLELLEESGGGDS